MIDICPPRPPELCPGSVIEFSDITEIRQFEDILPPFVNPRYSPASWEARPPIQDSLRIPNFNGRVGEITLRVMDEPYDQLVSAKERGWKLPSGPQSYLRKPNTQPLFLGFEFSGLALSGPRNKCLGTIKSEIWYAPPAETIIKPDKTGKVSIFNVDQKGDGLKRIITEPKLATVDMAARAAASRRVSFQVAQRALMRHLSATRLK